MCDRGMDTLPEAVMLEEINEVSRSQIEEDVLEIEENCKPEACLQVASLSKQRGE